jgi:putrescine carbamoyltransferase
MVKDFINIQDFSAEELTNLVNLIGIVKEARHKRVLPNMLCGASIGLIFEESSTRTRISFEAAATLLGGHAQYFRPGDLHLGKSESIYDTAKVMSRMLDAICIRGSSYQAMVDLAKYADVPVINMMADDNNHPTQVLCDVFTMFEAAGRIKGLNVTFVGDSKKGSSANVGRDLALISSIMGINFTFASPKEHSVDDEYLTQLRANAAESGATIRVTDDPIEAVSNADFVYTDEFVWYDNTPEEKKERLATFLPRYQVNAALVSHAPKTVRFMHCLPAHRNEEVTDEVMDAPYSIIFDQAENRLNTQVAILAAFVAPRIAATTVGTPADFADRILSVVSLLK